MRYIHAQWIKTKGTTLRLLLILLPIIFSLIFSVYFSFINPNFNLETEYHFFFTILDIAALFFSAVFIYMMIAIDKEATFFFQEMRADTKRWWHVMAKVGIIFFIILFVYCFSSLIFFILQGIWHNHWLPINQLVTIIIFHFLLLLPTVILYTWLSYVFNFSFVSITAILSTLAGIIAGTTGLGEKIWFYIPASWGLHFNNYFATSQFQQQVWASQSVLFSCIAGIIFILLSIGMIIWYNNWENHGQLTEE